MEWSLVTASSRTSRSAHLRRRSEEKCNAHASNPRRISLYKSRYSALLILIGIEPYDGGRCVPSGIRIIVRARMCLYRPAGSGHALRLPVILPRIDAGVKVERATGRIFPPEKCLSGRLHGGLIGR